MEGGIDKESTGLCVAGMGRISMGVKEIYGYLWKLITVVID